MPTRVAKPFEESDMARNIIITAVGKNRVGILAEITTEIANLGGNIMDISQKMMKDYFNLIMMVDVSGSREDFQAIKGIMEKLGRKNSVHISVQSEKVFRYMHRI